MALHTSLLYSELVTKDPQVRVSNYENGQKSGLKSIRDFAWAEGSLIQFRLEGRLIKGHLEVSCQFNVDGGPWQKMATFKVAQNGQNPEFYSFIEDFGNNKNLIRKAQFLNPTYMDNDKGQVHLFKKATFDPNEAKAKAQPCQSGFVIQTGNEITPKGTQLESL